MQITRNNHLKYLGKVTPFLILLYVIQILLYQKFAPAHLVGDMNLLLGIGLTAIIFSYHFYDYHHQIHFHRNYLEARFDLLKVRNTILYGNIRHISITKMERRYGTINLHLKDGTIYQLNHVDNPEEVLKFLKRQIEK